jgi:predicted esterase
VLAAALPYLNVVLPTAPLNADETHSWFSSAAADAGGPLSAAVERVDELVATELASGLPSSRILVGGFSQGGCLGIHTVLKCPYVRPPLSAPPLRGSGCGVVRAVVGALCPPDSVLVL